MWRGQTHSFRKLKISLVPARLEEMERVVCWHQAATPVDIVKRPKNSLFKDHLGYLRENHSLRANFSLFSF